MESAVVKILEITPAEYNPRVDLQPGDKDYESLKKSLDRFGMVEPLVINRKTGTLVSGHQRLKVLKELGEEEAEVIYIESEEEREKALNIALNQIDGEWDYEKLEALFAELPEEDIEFTGYTQSELDRLFDSLKLSDGFAGDDAESAEAATTGGTETAEEGEPPFRIYLSFPTKEAAKEWLEERGQEEQLAEHGNTTIRMEGADYATGD